MGPFLARLISAIRLLGLVEVDVPEAATQDAFGRSGGGDPVHEECLTTAATVVKSPPPHLKPNELVNQIGNCIGVAVTSAPSA